MYNKNDQKQPSAVFSPVDKVVGVLVLSDVLITGSFGLIAPLFAIFIAQNIQGATLEVIGIFTAIYLLTKSLFQLVTTELIQKIKGEKDEFYFDFIGAFAASMVYLIFPLINTVPELYVASFILGISAALTYPSWSALFNNHIKDTKTWGMYYTVLDCVLALAAMIGSMIAAAFSFDYLFLIIGCLGVAGSFILLIVKKDIFGSGKYIKSHSKGDMIEERILTVAKKSVKKLPATKTSTAKTTKKSTAKKTTTRKTTAKKSKSTK